MPDWLNYPAKQQIESGNSVYADAINHCPSYKNFWTPGDKVTSVHECTHGINNDIRNAHGAEYNIARFKRKSYSLPFSVPISKGFSYKITGGQKNAFYCLKDRAIVVTEPNCKKSDTIQFIPHSLRFGRYNLYVAGQHDWDNMPYYLFDEGVAYANGADCVIDMASRGEYKDKGNDFMFGPVEFLVYLAAVLMAADKASSLDDNMKNFAQWHFYRVVNIYYAGKGILPWDDMEKVVSALKSGTETQAIRDFLKDKIHFTFPEGPVPPDDKPLTIDDFDLL